MSKTIKPKPLTLRDAILAQMVTVGWTTCHLAREAKVDESSLYTFLSGRTQMRADNLEKLLRTLGLTIRTTPNG